MLPTLRRLNRNTTTIRKKLTHGDLGGWPMELPMKCGFVINVKAAKQISLTIPPSVLARGTK
jgi:hypothetical protein